MGSAHFFLDVFLRDISHRRHSTWTFSRNKFPPSLEQTLVVLNDVTFAVRLPQTQQSYKYENLLALEHGSLQRQITKALTAAISKQFLKNTSGYSICRSCYNCNSELSGQLCLLLPLFSCRRVWSHVFCGPHLRYLWRTPCTVMCSSKTPSCWQNRPKSSKIWNAVFQQNCVFHLFRNT